MCKYGNSQSLEEKLTECSHLKCIKGKVNVLVEKREWYRGGEYLKLFGSKTLVEGLEGYLIFNVFGVTKKNKCFVKFLYSIWKRGEMKKGTL